MELKKACLPGGYIREFEEGASIFEILNCKKDINEPFIAVVDGEEVEDLSKRLHYDANIKPLGMKDSLGAKAYLRTLIFVLVKAVKTLYPNARVILKNSLSRGLYGEIENIDAVTEDKINAIKEKMKEIIDSDLEIEKIKFKKSEAAKIFTQYGMEDKLRELKYIDLAYISLYKCEEFYDYFYGNMLLSTGYLKVYDLFQNGKGFILMSPSKGTDFTLPEFRDSPKLVKIFNETQRVSDIIDVSNVAALNDKVSSGEINDIILVSESLHEKKIGSIADEIFNKKEKIKLVTVAGPSSSGKTTFSKRLSIQLRLLGFHPYIISLSDYSIDRKYVPSDENGQYYFESVNGLDVKLFNEHLSMLFNGEEVSIPKFDFLAGKRVECENKFKMGHNSLLIVEGIHGLNEMLSEDIPKENKFKIYVSALTQLNIDDHNTMEPKDIRKCRRIIKDSRKMGIKAEDTINIWAAVDKVENESVFPFQEEADAMFNSTVIYEMSILRKYIEPLLRSIPKKNPAFIEATRLLDIVSCFKEAEEKNIPQNSIIKEFIGKSCFED